MRYLVSEKSRTETGRASKRTLNPNKPCQKTRYAQKQIGRMDVQEPKTIVLNSSKKPGAFPTLCPGTNKLETFVLTDCTNDTVDAEKFFLLMLTGRSGFAPQPP